MNTLLHLTIDTTQIKNDVQFRAAFNTMPSFEYTAGAFWIKTDNSPAEFRRIIAPAVGDVSICVFRVTTDVLRDAVLDADTRGWLGKTLPGVTLNVVAA